MRLAEEDGNEREEGEAGEGEGGASRLRALCAALAEHDVHVSVRGGCVRVSLYVFNTPQEVSRFSALFTQLLLLPPLLPSPSPSLSPSPGGPVRVLVTGAAGWLGQALWSRLLAGAADSGLDLFAGFHSSSNSSSGSSSSGSNGSSNKEGPDWVARGRRVGLDLRDRASVLAAVRAVRPHCVFHLAALSSPAACHKDASAAFAVNCPLALSEALRSECPQSLLVFASSDLVYDGLLGSPYRPCDAAYPANIYGASKLQFEAAVLALRRGFVLRLSNVVGPGEPFAALAGPGKFLQFLHSAYRSRQFIGLKADERRSFVWLGDVLAVCEALLRRHCPRGPGLVEQGEEEGEGKEEGEAAGAGGLPRSSRLLNVGGPDSLSRLDLAQLLCGQVGGQLVVYRMRLGDFSVKLDTLRTSPAAEGSLLSSSSSTAAAATTTTATSTATPSAVWEVYSMSDPLNNAAKNSAAISSSSELVSPKDVSMDSSATEKLLDLQFSHLEAVLLSCLE